MDTAANDDRRVSLVAQLQDEIGIRTEISQCLKKRIFANNPYVNRKTKIKTKNKAPVGLETLPVITFEMQSDLNRETGNE